MKGLKVRTMNMLLHDSRFETLIVKGLKIEMLTMNIVLYDSRFHSEMKMTNCLHKKMKCLIPTFA